MRQNYFNLKWIECKIEDIADKIHYGYTATAKQERNGVKYLRITDIQNGKVDWNNVPICDIDDIEIEKFQLFPNDLVFARTGGTVGKSYLIPNNIPAKAVFASYLIRIKINRNVNPKFIYQFFQSPNYWKQINFGKTGLKTNVNAQILSKLQFKLPPLPEQRAIVARIEELFSRLDKGIETLQLVKEQLKVYRQAVLKWAFEGKLTAEWRALRQAQGTLPTAEELLEKIKTERERHYQQKLAEWQKAVEEWETNGKPGKKPAKPKKPKELPPLTEEKLADWPRLPEGWIKIPIEYICEIEDGDRGKNYPKKQDFLNKGYCVFLNAKNVTSNGFNFKELQFISKDKHLSLGKGTLKLGDIVFTSRGTIGNTAYYSYNIKFKCLRINSGMFILRGFESWLDAHYFLYGLRAPIIRQQINALKSGTAQPQLPIREFKSFVFVLPCKKEQRAIVQEIETRLSLADKLEQIIDEALQKAEALRQSILKKAFEGKLLSEVEREALKNDPEWEPAEKLLERIKAEKETLEKNKNNHKKK